MSMKYDICIIGAGPAGYSGALRAAREGRQVCLVEKDRVGGTCLNRGCIPTKALRQCATALAAAREARRFGVVIAGEPGFDYAAAAKHRDQVTAGLVSGVAALLKARKVTLVTGSAQLAAPGKAILDGKDGRQEIAADQIVIAAGSKPCDLPGIKIDEETVLSSEGALRLPSLPKSVIVIGAGVIGCEFADILSTFGAQVAVVETLDRILLSEDRSTAKAVQKILEARGIKFYLGTTVQDLTETDQGLRCQMSNGQEIFTEKMIVSVGRRPAVDGLGLESAGVVLDKGAIKTDGGGRTSVAGVWAAGDVIGPPMLAHVAAHEMEVVIDNLLGRAREFDREVVPAVIFVRPEVASVGLLEDQAKAKGVVVEVGRFAYAASGKAQCLGETEGFAKVITETGTGRILGGTVMGAHAAELIHELAVAIKAGLKVANLVDVIHAHPTLSEIILEAVADAQGLAVHKIGRERSTAKTTVRK